MKPPSKLLILLTLAFMSLVPMTFGQAEKTEPAKAAPEAKAAVHEKTMWEQIKEGGWVMIPIAICSMATLYLIADGVLRTTSKKAIPAEHAAALQAAFRAGDYMQAYAFCKNNPSAFTNVCRAGLGLLGEGKKVVEEAVASELSKEFSKMMTFISYLSVIGVCTPMIGLLGTVTGMMSAFAVLGQSGIGDPSKLSAAIGEVLTATASGLFIAIPAFMGYYFLRNRATRAVHDIQDSLNALFRKMPYEHLAGANIGDEEQYANMPNWLHQDAA